MEALHAFLYGFLTASALIAATFFLRFFTLTADRLFLCFAAAFLALALNWFALALTDPAAENRYYVFLLRLLAFAFIIYAILDKNRRSRPSVGVRR